MTCFVYLALSADERIAILGLGPASGELPRHRDRGTLTVPSASG